MGSIDDGGRKEEIEESDGTRRRAQVPFQVSGSSRMLLGKENLQTGKFRNSLAALPDRIKFLKFGSASGKFKQLAQERDEISRSVSSSSSHGFRDRIRKIDWTMLINMSKEWFRNPMNLALFVWIACVAISGALLFLVMTGMLNSVLPNKSQRNTWFEVNNQILNALFTLMCLYQHPKRIYHLTLLFRWKPEDISNLRKIYCKNGTYKPYEWTHMMVVVVLLHINCFAQYALCGLNLGYKRSQRPAVGVGICISFAIAAPAAAGVYSMLSPLGRDYNSEVDEEAQVQATAGESSRPEQLRSTSMEKRYSFASRDDQRVVEASPRWRGGILDIWDDISLAYLSLFCTFCVFGWNMERLGFGNMYVHIATFLLFCMAPFWIFILAAVNINNETVREALGLTGVILCAFGLLYGGFWRIQMRKRFKLPTYTFCFGEASISDCALWLCCCWCSLAQEVRTGNSYDIVEDKLILKQFDGNSEDGAIPRSPLVDDTRPSSIKMVDSPSPTTVSKGHNDTDRQLYSVIEDSSAGGSDQTMKSPAPFLIKREAI